ncbi:TauD/TfdA family dioxygenase [Pseudoalteromonas aurantia]|uniref:TauD/TfdA-like domain-containing protein n=1 Tax=Pseudoalteromonas aurantia 208 TaxID=1314867 RepID=A0ABR9EG19_9GAMM|nr:TauD/TfdA family dioxygenase [Pseudoalteromonas aurantia]MBE0369958.1 hypothetical protein [Pseudoalteromonas aurantia 208]
MELRKECSSIINMSDSDTLSTSVVLVLSELEKKKIEKIIGEHQSVESDDGAEIMYSYLETWTKFPERIKKKLLEFKFKGNTNSYLLLKNLPLQAGLCPTPPKKHDVISRERDFAALLQSVISVSLGYLYNFKDKITSGLVDDVFPIKQDSNKQVGTNSVFLEWHVEDGFHEMKADYVSLLCLREDHKVQTYLMPARHLNLSDSDERQLSKFDYLIWEDLTFINDGELQSSKVQVLDGTSDPEIIYDPAYMEACSNESKDAMAAVKESIVKNCISLSLAEGDLLIFDNRRVVHSRNAYEPKFNGEDRWLLRTLIVESWWKAKNKKVSSTLFVN